MIRNAARGLTLALTLAALIGPTSKALAQSSTPPAPPPPPPPSNIVTGTDPAPDVVGIVLIFLHLA